MKDTDRKFWPYKPKLSIIWAVILLIVLLLTIAILRSIIGWPSDASTNTVLIGILVLSLLPVLLAILDVIIDRGGTIGYGDFKIDFSKMKQSGFSGFTIPANIGVRGRSVTDSDTINILESLRQATTSSVAVIDLEDGLAWWETRLFVLLSGAKRLGNPDKIVFVATKAGTPQTFIGWSYPNELLKCFLKIYPQFLRAYYISKAVANQWKLVEPLYPVLPLSAPIPNAQPWMQATALSKTWMAFDGKTGLLNELFEEQVLQNELGREIEEKEGAKCISISRLNELFESVLIGQSIDTRWPNDKQNDAFFSSDASFIAIKENNKYSALVSKQMLFNEALKSIFGNQTK